MPRGRPRKYPKQEDAEVWSTDATTKIVEFVDNSVPRGPYTLWCCDGDTAWGFRDFDTLDDALAFPGRSLDFIIMKPVQYRVIEEGSNPPPKYDKREVPQGTDDDYFDLGGPTDPDNPDSGKARYI